MVKKTEKPPLDESARRIAAAIKGLMRERNATQEAVSVVIADLRGPRAQSYVSERVSGVSAWDTRELELLAHYFGFKDTFDLIAEAQRRTQP